MAVPPNCAVMDYFNFSHLKRIARYRRRDTTKPKTTKPPAPDLKASANTPIQYLMLNQSSNEETTKFSGPYSIPATHVVNHIRSGNAMRGATMLIHFGTAFITTQ